MSNLSIHDGHRDRLRNRFRAEGLDNFTDVQVLELLLFYCIPRQDTNALAHLLIDQFGSLSQVLETSPEELKKVKGIGEKAATFLNMIPAVTRYYGVERGKREDKPLRTINDCGNYLREYFRGHSNETVYLLCLDAKCKPLCCPKIGEGSVNSAGVPIRRVVEAALGANATSVILAHNHPSGLALPSHEDVVTTRRVAAALDAVEVRLADHIVVADGDFTSLLQSGYYRPGECTLKY
jgi:DNA repair protein RadC